MTTIAFIGLGNMGGPMARNLVSAGLAPVVYDIVPELATAFDTAAATLADAVSNADIIITMLPGDNAMRAVYNNVLQHAKTGALLADCSTISADLAKTVAAEAEAKGLRMIDAPVSGGTAGAAAGTLTFIVGGDAPDLDAIRPVLEKMGKNIFHAGGHGAGQIVKICNNMLLAIHMIGTAEALNMAQAFGLDVRTVSEIISKSSGRNWSLEVYNPLPGTMDNVPSARGYTGGFGTDLMVKDLTLAQSAAASVAAATPLGARALELYRQHSDNGNGKLDFSSIAKMLAGD
jgi:3-hydroxyisobutyrate dehydrogenase